MKLLNDEESILIFSKALFNPPLPQNPSDLVTGLVFVVFEYGSCKS